MKLFGHEAMSRTAIAQFVDGLPPNLKFIEPFLAEDIVHHSLNRDVLDVFGGHWSDAGQRHHFMRAANETEHQAYRNGLTWIEKNGREAAGSLRRLYAHGTTRNFNAGHIAGPLGYAFHALQDSYAPMHVTRKTVGTDHIITKIHVYTQQDSAVHGASDICASKNLDTPLNQDAIAACREFTKMVVVASLERTDPGYLARWTSLWRTFVSMCLREQLAVPAR